MQRKRRRAPARLRTRLLHSCGFRSRRGKDLLYPFRFPRGLHVVDQGLHALKKCFFAHEEGGIDDLQEKANSSQMRIGRQHKNVFAQIGSTRQNGGGHIDHKCDAVSFRAAEMAQSAALLNRIRVSGMAAVRSDAPAGENLPAFVGAAAFP